MDITAQKQALRREAKARRALLPGAAETVAAAALPCIAKGSVVAGFFALGTELDPAALLATLAARGDRLCLAAVSGTAQPLLFRGYKPGDPLVPGPYGTSEPGPAAPLLRPDVVLVPLLAFDRQGWRLGYGGGYYDRSLRALRAEGPLLAIGLAYAAQEVASVPHDEKDERLDLVVTEQGVLSCTEMR
jgi:5-formyltetrahydrofolate cyclo-ligase